MQYHPRDEAASWYGQAASDLESARWSLEGRRYDTVCFASSHKELTIFGEISREVRSRV